MPALHKEIAMDDSPKPKQNVKFMLAYCRKYIPGFAEMHDKAKASRAVKVGAKKP